MLRPSKGFPAMSLNEPTARSILEAAHAAWNRQDLEDMLTWYHDDIAYYNNAGGIDGNVVKLYRKSDMRAFLQPLLNVADCMSVPLTFNYRDGVGRAQVEVVIRHRRSGIKLKGTYRQFVTFQDLQIIAHEEFHDAARMKAFWAMVQSPANPVEKNRTIIAKLLSQALRPQPPCPPQPADE